MIRIERVRRIKDGWLVSLWEGNQAYDKAMNDDELVHAIMEEKEEREEAKKRKE